jgi:DNA invertase Pin-like site-specific DNA recombinase
MMQKRAAIYVRVSTDKQTIDNQVAALRQIAERRGWHVIASDRRSERAAAIVGDGERSPLGPPH